MSNNIPVHVGWNDRCDNIQL